MCLTVLTLNVVNVDITPGHESIPGVHPPEDRVHHGDHPPANVQTILDPEPVCPHRSPLVHTRPVPQASILTDPPDQGVTAADHLHHSINLANNNFNANVLLNPNTLFSNYFCHFVKNEVKQIASKLLIF